VKLPPSFSQNRSSAMAGSLLDTENLFMDFRVTKKYTDLSAMYCKRHTSVFCPRLSRS
jgi:hypothetical protein